VNKDSIFQVEKYKYSSSKVVKYTGFKVPKKVHLDWSAD
jgi:hypothetical protein